MLTVEELCAVPFLADVSRVNLEMLAATVADMRLGPGEYAVHEGEDPALFVVLAGNMEAVKLVDGALRVIGQRPAGKLFGEVPLVFGTPFQAGFRATEASRVLRVEARVYRAVAAATPSLAQQLSDLAQERIGGLQSIAARASGSQVVMAGHRWDPRCLEIRRFLSRNRITFDWAMPDAANFAETWHADPPSEGAYPVVRLGDGTLLTTPTLRGLAERLGFQTEPRHREYDTIIVGGGPAGLAAAVYGASEGLRTLVIEREAPGGQAGTSSRIENYLGFPNGVSGDELATRALQQAKRLGAEILIARSIERFDAVGRTVWLDGGEPIKGRTVILASGVTWRRLDIEGFDRLIGKGIYYGAARSESGVTQGLDIHLIGAGNSAGQAALFFSNHARSVTLLVRSGTLEKSMSHYLIEQIRGKSNIAVALGTEVAAVHGDDHLTAIDLRDRSGNVQRVPSGALFVFIGADAETGWLPPDVLRDARGFVLTGADVPRQAWRTVERDPFLLETSAPGVFACGDVRLSPVKRVAAAVGEGSMAIAFVHQYLARETSAGRA